MSRSSPESNHARFWRSARARSPTPDTTIRFTADHPPPDEIISRLSRIRPDEIGPREKSRIQPLLPEKMQVWEGPPRPQRHEGDPGGRSSGGATPSTRNQQGPSQEEEDSGHGGDAKDVETGVWETIVDVYHDVRYTFRAG